MRTDWTKLTDRCRDAMELAAKSPGRYGGRYVARRTLPRSEWATRGDTEFVVLDDDDPDLYRDDEALDIIAHVMPKVVHPIGRANQYLGKDGAVTFGD